MPSASGRSRQARRVDLQQRDVGVRIEADDPRRHLVAVGERDVDLLGLLDRRAGAVGDDVRVGRDLARAVEHEARPDARAAVAAERRRGAGKDAEDRHDAGRVARVDPRRVEGVVARGAAHDLDRRHALDRRARPRSRPVVARRVLAAAAAERQRQRRDRGDRHDRASHAGSSSENVVRPGAVSTSSEPRMRSASSRAIARPRPDPWASSEVKNGSKTRARGLVSDARAVVADAEPHGAVLACRGDDDAGPGGGVCERVVDQDPQDLRHALRIADGLDRLVADAQLELGCVLVERGCKLRRHARREIAEVGRLGTQLERAGLQARQVEQVGGELAEPRDLLAHDRDELAPRLVVEVLVLEQLEEAAEREDRRTQLVRRGRDEAPARGLDLGELALHVVQRARELAELVVAVGREDGPEVTGRDALGAALEQLHAACDLGGEDEAAGEREQHPERARDRGSACGSARRCPARPTAATRTRRRA